MIQLHYLNWDSERLGIRCGLIDASNPKSLIPVDEIGLKILDAIDIGSSYDFITIKLHQDLVHVVSKLIERRAILIDTELTFASSGTTATIPQDRIDDLKCVFCRRIESAPFLPLAEEMNLSRFFRDRHISYEKAIHLWRESIKNHCAGFADELLVAYLQDVPCGLVTLRFVDSGILDLHIVGVLKEFQGRSIGVRMVRSVVEKYGRDCEIKVETQSTNIAAQRAYQKAGFRFHSLSYILHYWA